MIMSEPLPWLTKILVLLIPDLIVIVTSDVINLLYFYRVETISINCVILKYMLMQVYITITFWLCLMTCGISVSWPGPRPQQWKPRILTTRLPENSKSTLLKAKIYYAYYRVMWLIMRNLSFISCIFNSLIKRKDSMLNESSVYQTMELITFSIKMAIMLEMDEFHLLFWMRKLSYP